MTFMRFLIGVSLLIFSSLALASKARLAALQGAELAHLVDPQTLFMNPAHSHMLPSYLTFEMGPIGQGAEGGFLQSLESGLKVAVYLGRQNQLRSFESDSLPAINGFSSQVNPIEVTWGEGVHAFGISLSRLDDEANGIRENTLIAKYGYLGKGFEFWGHLHLLAEQVDQVAGESRNLQTHPALVLGSRYTPDQSFVQYFAQFHFVNSQLRPAGPSIQAWDSQVSIGLEHRELRSPEFDWYYGLRLDYTKRESEQDSQDIAAYQLPAFLGAEIKLSSHVISRASLSQNILVGQRKVGTNPSAAIVANTHVSVGLGLRYNQALLDGVLVASNSGNLGVDPLMFQTSFTYDF